MDLIELIEEKSFIGQEFLTWLWWKSEERGGSVALDEYGDILIVFEKHMLLESGEGESAEKLICSGLQTELKEARTGLSLGKKLEQARILLTHDAYEYHVTLTGGTMDFKSVRLPKTAAAEDKPDNRAEELEGVMLERIFLFETLTRIVHKLFRMFLTLRIGDGWPQEAEKVRAWIGQTARA
ncbi:MAG: hypothetical protein LBU39_01490 [Desulfobulbaceae bacterium]|jgi:recombination associated protein RdgC|nr:hypothetical protein [Desulfobulbaceae bacterium]